MQFNKINTERFVLDSAKLKAYIVKYAAAISVGLILLFSGYLTIVEIDHQQAVLTDKSDILISQVSDAIQSEIQKRVDILMLFKDAWLATSDLESCYSAHRFETRVPSYYNITPGFKAINWIDVNGTIRWVYPYEENILVVNRSIVILKGDVFNTGFEFAQETGNMGVIGLIELYQGGWGFTTYIPLIYNNTLTGYLNGVFDLNILFGELFAEDSGFVGIDPYSVEISFDNFSIYQKNENFTVQEPFVVTQELSVLDSFKLTLVLRPLTDVVNGVSLRQNSSILVLGTSLAVLVGILVQSLITRNRLLRISSQEKASLMQELHIQQKMESLGTLAGGIAHDFNNLLAGIQGNVSLIDFNVKTLQESLKGSDDSEKEILSEMATDLSEIQSLIKNSGKTVNQITQFSHSPSAEIKPLNIKPMIYDLLKGFRKMIDRRIITVADLTRDEVYLFGDESRFNQILLNLWINARDAIGSNTGEIKITTRLVPKKNTPKIPKRGDLRNYLEHSTEIYDKEYELEIHLSDTGVGIPKDIQQKIFDPFFSTKGTSRNGTGLGLTIVYNSVESMDGSISVDSEVGKGSTFILNFPILHKEFFPQMLNSELVKLDETSIFDFQQYTILLIEDERLIRNSIEKFLQKCRATVYTASSGTKGLSLYRSFPHQFDVVILDINLPGMNGIDIYKNIKGKVPHQPVLFITGFSKFGIPPRDEFDLGYMTKPFKLTELAKRIQSIKSGTTDKKDAP